MNVVTRNALKSLARRRFIIARASSSTSTSAATQFPCVDAHKAREARLLSSSPSPNDSSGPEPPYARPSPASYKTFHHPHPHPLTYGSQLPSFDIAYETWGSLNPAKDNAILLHTGLSASSHAASTKLNPADGWWEKFIGPGKALDTNQFYLICTNVLGGCYGSTGPSSLDPTSSASLHDATRYGTNFPILSIFDMVSAQFHLLDHMGIDKLYASVGCSMGAMQSLAAAWLHPDRVGKVVSISGSARSSPGSVAMRYAQRSGMY
jgi:homoserine O-acetyltransferase